MKKFVKCIVAFGLACACGGCRGMSIDSFDNSPVMYEHADSYKDLVDVVTVQNVDAVEVNWICGDVEITYSSKDAIGIHEEKKDNQLVGKYYVDHNTLYIQPCETGTISSKDVEKKLVVEIPQSLEMDSISINSVSGEISVNEVFSKNLEINTVSGKALINDGEITTIMVDTVSADVTLSSAFKSLEANAVSGNVEVNLKDDIPLCVDFTSISGRKSIDMNYMDAEETTCSEESRKIAMSSVSSNLEVHVK